MCGIVGFWKFQADASENFAKENIRNMSKSIVSRGPDAYGEWFDLSSGIVLGHRRLSIIDTSNNGIQPMLSKCGRFVIVYNGEIYNAADIAKSLKNEGVKFKGSSDTEVLLEAISHWGIEKTLPNLIGMFAFAIWDKKDKKVILVRDRIGIKPLYWGIKDKLLLFASQSKSFREYKGLDVSIDREVLSKYIRLSYIPTNESIYDGFFQVKPGNQVTIYADGKFKVKKYWDLSQYTKHIDISEDEATKRLEELLEDSVKKRMISDVPIGAFLSGGVDSSLVVSLMQKFSNTPIKTFTVGFEEAEYDESKYAKKIADHLGTNHTEIIVNSSDILSLVPNITDAYDEPFADPSLLPTMLISNLIRKHVTVALSGDGGDELFVGYNRYLYASFIQRIFKILPYLFRKIASKAICSVSPSSINGLFSMLRSQSLSGDKIHKFAGLLGEKSIKDIYPYLISQWRDADVPVLGVKSKKYSTKEILGQDITTIEDMQEADMEYYLPGDILTKIDRASMAYGLEARVPILDHRVVEFAFSLPTNMKLTNSITKKILRRILYKHIPRDYIERPKQGFGVPIDSWLRGELREWAEDLLNVDKIRRQGYLNASMLKNKWDVHLSGKRNFQNSIWNILMFQVWVENYG